MINPFLTKPNYIRIYYDIVENSISVSYLVLKLLTKDNIPTIFHDYSIFSKTYLEEISKYTIGSVKPETKYAKRFKNQKPIKGEKIPKLTDFFKLVAEDKHKDVFLNLEIKSTLTQENVTPNPEKMVSLILKDIKEYDLENRTLITSYDWRILYELKKQNPNILRGFITLIFLQLKNIYENSPWMVKNYPMEELFLLPNIIKSLGDMYGILP